MKKMVVIIDYVAGEKMRQFQEFEKYGCRYADPELAAHFSQERMVNECNGVTPLCFHKWEGENRKYPRFTGIPIIPF